MELQGVLNGLYGGHIPATDTREEKTGRTLTGADTFRKQIMRAAGWAEPGDEEVAAYFEDYRRVQREAGHLMGMDLTAQVAQMSGDNLLATGETRTVNLGSLWADDLRELLKEQFAKLSMNEQRRWIQLLAQMRASTESE